MTRDGEDYEADQRAAINRQSFAVAPPAETPKACPTCGGRGELKYPGACRINCNRCGGSGIDGGTADGD